MKVPLNWLRDYVKIPDQVGLTDKLTMAGHMLDKIEIKNKHTIIDLELRGNRADCYSILGIAREVAALFNTPVKYPSIKEVKAKKELTEVKLNIKTPLVKRVMMTTIKNVKLSPSPKWLKEKLEEYGVESINNIVDLTNFVMIETGEPMHAFDLDKIGKELQIRLAKDGEQMTTFQDKNITLTKEDLVWVSGKTVLSIAGAIGEKHHSISDDTKNILLEAANYDRANIRRSIHRHNLFTDAGIRHEKDLDPNLVNFAVQRFIQLIEENKWGVVSKTVSDYYPEKVTPWKVSLNYEFINSLSGIEIKSEKIKKILKSLNFEIVKEAKDGLELLVPTYRTDVRLEEDVIEEVLRIYGYDQIPAQVLSLEIPEDITPKFITQELNIKNTLVSVGLDEVISSTFVREDLHNINKSVKKSQSDKVKIINRPSPDIEELRASLLPNLFDVSQKVRNERGEEVRFFEVGKVYEKKNKEYVEGRKLGIISWSKQDSDFYTFKGILDTVLEKLGLYDIEFDNETGLNNIGNQYKIKIGKNIIGYGGIYKDNHYVEIDLDSILEKTNKPKVNLWPKHPPQIQDLTFEIPEQTKIGEVITTIKGTQNVAQVELTDVFKNAYTFRIWYQHPQKTLDSHEVERLRSKIVADLNKNFGINIKG